LTLELVGDFLLASYNSKLTASYIPIDENNKFSDEAEKNTSERSSYSMIGSNKRTFQRRLDFEEDHYSQGKNLNKH
jgi:hypothetical protein